MRRSMYVYQKPSSKSTGEEGLPVGKWLLRSTIVRRDRVCQTGDNEPLPKKAVTFPACKRRRSTPSPTPSSNSDTGTNEVELGAMVSGGLPEKDLPMTSRGKFIRSDSMATENRGASESDDTSESSGNERTRAAEMDADEKTAYAYQQEGDYYKKIRTNCTGEDLFRVEAKYSLKAAIGALKIIKSNVSTDQYDRAFKKMRERPLYRKGFLILPPELRADFVRHLILPPE